jgi:hypothetical protein
VFRFLEFDDFKSIDLLNRNFKREADKRLWAYIYLRPHCPSSKRKYEFPFRHHQAPLQLSRAPYVQTLEISWSNVAGCIPEEDVDYLIQCLRQMTKLTCLIIREAVSCEKAFSPSIISTYPFRLSALKLTSRVFTPIMIGSLLNSQSQSLKAVFIDADSCSIDDELECRIPFPKLERINVSQAQYLSIAHESPLRSITLRDNPYNADMMERLRRSI